MSTTRHYRRSKPSTYRPILELLEERSLLSAGNLDPTFGNGGVVAKEQNDGLVDWRMALQSDGKFVEVGTGDAPQGSFELMRQNADGSPDASFGSGGQVVFVPPSSTSAQIGDTNVPGFAGWFSPSAVVAEPNGDILVAGSFTYSLNDYGPPPGSPSLAPYYSVSANEIFVACFHPDGSLNASFGTDGVAFTRIGHDSSAVALVLDFGNTFVVAGQSDRQFALARYSANGALDATFGNGGMVTTAISRPDGLDSSAQAAVTSLAIQTDGKIVAAGTSAINGITSWVVLARYNPDGSLDSPFGIVMTADVPSGYGDDIAQVAVDAYGNTVVAATANHDIRLYRFQGDGKLDLTFGTGGVVDTGIAAAQTAPIPALALQADGKIILGVTEQQPNSFVYSQFLLTRYTTDGSLDSTFGTGGQTTTTFGVFPQLNPASDLTFFYFSDPSLTLEPDGSIMVCLSSMEVYIGGDGHWILARFTNDALPQMPAPLNDPPTLVATGSDPDNPSQVNVYNADTQALLFSFTPFDPHFMGGVRVAVRDLNGDGIPDIICAAGAGGGPRVTVYSGQDGSVLEDFMAFDPDFTGGVSVAAGDVTGDGQASIICGAGTGGGPQVNIFGDGKLVSSFMAFDPRFSGGITVAAGNVLGTGQLEVVVGAGVGGGPNVAVFEGNGTQLASFFVFDPTMTSGLAVSTDTAATTGHQSIIAATSGNRATFWFNLAAAENAVAATGNPTAAQLDAFFAADPGLTGGLFVVASTG